jgi:hypothetical protein
MFSVSTETLTFPLLFKRTLMLLTPAPLVLPIVPVLFKTGAFALLPLTQVFPPLMLRRALLLNVAPLLATMFPLFQFVVPLLMRVRTSSTLTDVVARFSTAP